MSFIAVYRKGVALVVVLATVVVVASLAVAILSIILNHAQLASHKINRMQAYYSGLAAMNLAIDKIRTGAWGNATVNETRSICKTGCSSPNISDYDIAYNATVMIGYPGTAPDGKERLINITVDY